MDTLTSSKVQMSGTLSPLKKDDRGDQQFFEVNENQELNGLKRQRLIDCLQNTKIHNIPQQPCACDVHTYENDLHPSRCVSSPNATNGAVQSNGTHKSTNIDTVKPNGFHHIEQNRKCVKWTDSDDCNVLMQLHGVQNGLSGTNMKSLDEMDKCSNIIVNGDDQNGSEHVINRAHRRARARSSDSIQAEFYHARKQQMRLQSQNDSNLLTNGNNDSQSNCNESARATHGTTLRGKSLSPPKVAANKKQTFNYHNRCATQRHIFRHFNILRKQKLLSKAKARLSPSSPSSPTSAMGKSVANIEPPVKQETEKLNQENDKANSSESEYSSLEDDDDVQEPDDSDDTDNEFVETYEGRVDSKELYNTFGNGTSLHPMLADSVQGQSPKSGPLTASLFANVPPYITFASHDEKGPQMPLAIKKVLRWKLTTITPIVIRKVLINSGFRLLKQTNDWMGTWGKHMKSPCFRTLRPQQKMNHIPGTFQIGRKDKIWRNLQMQMLRNGRQEFNFMPLTYILPADAKRLKRLWPQFDQRNTKWIIKPPASARGTGIKVVSRWQQIPKRKPMIVQKYVDRPLLINGSKFDLRLYVLITSLNPLRAYMHTEGLARFASVKYSNNVDTLNDRYMHLTNYSIHKLSSNYTKNEDVDSCVGHKWTLKSLWKHLSAQGINTNGLWAALRNLVLRTVLSGEHVINQMGKSNVGSKYNTFELFGIDVILDSELKPWLLEVNISPSLHSSSPLDLFVKGPLVTAVLNTVRFNVPSRFNASQQSELTAELGLKEQPLCFDRRLHTNMLSKNEQLKHTQFTDKSITNRDQYLDSILENLTPDDLRCLIATEDELARCAPLERICPTPNSHRYIKFTEKPRYHNRLLDAWEYRFSNKREEGIQLLQKHCENGLHLIVPTQIAKQNAKKTAEEKLISENETGDVFDATNRIVCEKNNKFLETIGNAPKIIDDCKSPLPTPDDQLNEAAIDQQENLVSSFA